MALVLGGLSDEEIKALCKLPLRLKSERFARAEKSLRENIHHLPTSHPGMHICIDAESLIYKVGKSHKQASQKLIGREARDFIYIEIPPIPTNGIQPRK